MLAVKGYIMAYGLITMYCEDNTATTELAIIRFKLYQMIKKFERNKLDIKSLMSKTWIEFDNLTGNQDKELSILSIIFDLIAKNPNKNKNKALTEIVMKLRLGTAYSKDVLIKDSKSVVNSFYGLDKEKGK